MLKVEDLIVLIIGRADDGVTPTILQLMAFLLWRFHPKVREIMSFVPSKMGPYSLEIREAVASRQNYWVLKEGKLYLTQEGVNAYNRLGEKVDDKLLFAVDLVTSIYSRLNEEELLFLMYTEDVAHEYFTSSKFLEDIMERKEEIVDELIRKQVIIEEMKEDILKRANLKIPKFKNRKGDNMEIVGATFPVPRNYLERILNEGKNVFVKPATLRIKPGMKIIFYASRENQGFHGEAEVESVEYFTNVEEIIKKYKDRLFLTPEELRKYERDRARWHSRGRKPRPWMVVVLKNVRKYPNIVKPKRFIAVSGRYVRESEYKEILRKAGL